MGEHDAKHITPAGRSVLLDLAASALFRSFRVTS
jgi:hypothetical protein